MTPRRATGLPSSRTVPAICDIRPTTAVTVVLDWAPPAKSTGTSAALTPLTMNDFSHQPSAEDDRRIRVRTARSVMRNEPSAATADRFAGAPADGGTIR